jgi:hypothetical protein
MYTVTDAGVLKTVEAWSVVLPLHDNDGEPFSPDIVDSVLAEILLSYPGFSIANTLGYWKGADQTFVDRNYQVLIDVVPDISADSSSFFTKLKGSLQKRLKQEKIYVTRQDAKQELLSFEEFFSEVGVQVSKADIAVEAANVAKRMALNIDFLLQRLGYETLVIRLDEPRDIIIWERRICGITIRSELSNPYPAGLMIIAADQFAQLGKALLSGAPFVLIGTYEYLTHVLSRQPQRLVEPRGLDWAQYPDPYTFSPSGEPLSAKRFVEDFTASVVTNCLILREEGFLAREIKVNVGSDGSMQHASSLSRSLVMHCPAVIPHKELQLEVMRCLRATLERLDNDSAGNTALMQAKAKNNYVLKRAIVRHVASTGRN